MVRTWLLSVWSRALVQMMPTERRKLYIAGVEKERSWIVVLEWRKNEGWRASLRRKRKLADERQHNFNLESPTINRRIF